MNESHKTAVIWCVVSAILSIVIISFNNSPMVLRAGFFTKFFGFILGTITGLIGAMIGDAIRKFSMPESFFTNGGILSIMKTKLFWMIGPQTIGSFLGAAFGITIVIKYF